MRRYLRQHRARSRVMAVAVLAAGIACSGGCDIRRIFGANWNINVYIPLGLASSPAMSSASTAATVPTTTGTNAGSLSIPLLGDLSGPADGPAA